MAKYLILICCISIAQMGFSLDQTPSSYDFSKQDKSSGHLQFALQEFELGINNLEHASSKIMAADSSKNQPYYLAKNLKKRRLSKARSKMNRSSIDSCFVQPTLFFIIIFGLSVGCNFSKKYFLSIGGNRNVVYAGSEATATRIRLQSGYNIHSGPKIESYISISGVHHRAAYPSYEKQSIDDPTDYNKNYLALGVGVKLYTTLSKRLYFFLEANKAFSKDDFADGGLGINF